MAEKVLREGERYCFVEWGRRLQAQLGVGSVLQEEVGRAEKGILAWERYHSVEWRGVLQVA